MAGRYRTEQERIDAMTVEISVSYNFSVLSDTIDPMSLSFCEALNLKLCAES